MQNSLFAQFLHLPCLSERCGLVRPCRVAEIYPPLEDPDLSGPNGMFLKFLFHRGEMLAQWNSAMRTQYLGFHRAGLFLRDQAQIVKSYEAEPIGAGRHSPPKVTSTEKTVISGNPNMSKISTSYVERQNLTMRISMRRFTRLTNAFSKKADNLKAAVALHFAYYNFVRILHRTLRTTPAKEVGVDNRVWSIGDLVALAN